MKAGINVWTWGTKSKEAFEQALKEVADIGYPAVENIGTIVTLYEDDPDEFDALMETYGVEFACAYHHLTGDWEKDLAMAKRVLAFLERCGTKIMNLQAGPRPKGGTTDKELSGDAEKASQIGELARQHGVTVCLHPHYGTNVEQADELAYMMEQLDPASVSLTIDTAHTVLGGMDPVETVTQYADRIRYMHMKDILPSVDPDLPWWSGFRELGRGTIDLPGVVNVLKDAGFSGVLCVELDRPRICGYKSAALSRAYIREELGL
jgi:inosose dehydratase